MANPIGATIPANITGVTDAIDRNHMSLNVRRDDKQIRLNSREFSQASGNSIAFQAKPNQTVTTTGEVIGGEISPRVQSGVGAGVLKGLHVDFDIKGAASTGNITDARVLELEAVDAGANSRTYGDVTFVRVRSNLSPDTLTTDQSVIKVEPKEGASDFTAFAVFGSTSAIALVTGSTTGALPANTGFIRVKVAGTYMKIPLYAD